MPSIVELAGERYTSGWVSDDGESITSEELAASASYWPIGITDIIPLAYTIDQASATFGQVSVTYSATTSVTVGALAS